MTRDTPDSIDVEIATDEEFQTILHQLVLAANRNGVDPRGAWEFRTGETVPDWEVIITELAKGVDD